MKVNHMFLYLIAGVFGLMAQAEATVIFDFGKGGDGRHSHTVMDTTNTYSVTVEAFKADDSNANINRNRNGWGVHGKPGNHRMDNGEYLEFDLAPKSFGLLAGVFLDHKGGVETFDLFVDGVLAFNDVAIPNDTGTTKQFIDLSSLTADPSSLNGKVFKFVGGAGSGTRISQLQFVPEPTILTLLGLGIAGIGYRRHHTKIARMVQIFERTV